MKNTRATGEVRTFLESTSTTELRRLLDTPVFSGTVLIYAAKSELLSQRVDTALDAEFDGLSPQARSRIDHLAGRIRAKTEVNLKK